MRYSPGTDRMPSRRHLPIVQPSASQPQSEPSSEAPAWAWVLAGTAGGVMSAGMLASLVYLPLLRWLARRLGEAPGVATGSHASEGSRELVRIASVGAFPLLLLAAAFSGWIAGRGPRRGRFLGAVSGAITVAFPALVAWGRAADGRTLIAAVVLLPLGALAGWFGARPRSTT